MEPFRDIGDSVVREIAVSGSGEGARRFSAEFFYNQFNIFCLLTPLGG